MIIGALFLIYMDTLMGQIEDIVKKEKRKQAWVPVTKETWATGTFITMETMSLNKNFCINNFRQFFLTHSKLYKIIAFFTAIIIFERL